MQAPKGSTVPHSVDTLPSYSTTYRRTAVPAFSKQSMDAPVKEGFLQKAHPKDGIFSVTIWQKRYFVLWGTGTVEYYTNYNKKADEYCGTLNMVDCEDMVAPITVGKRHNVIKLTMKQKDRLKDYWLDCECPPLMNEWVQLLANASGLVPEESVPIPPLERCVNVTESAGPALVDRPLPPTPVKTDADYEIPTRSGSLDSSDLHSMEENYEEIGSTSSTDSLSDWEPVPPKRYSKAASLKRCSENVQEAISTQGLLKKSALPSAHSASRKSPTRTSFSPPLGTSTVALGPVPGRRSDNVKKGAPRLSPFGDATASELRERFSQRKEEVCTTAELLSPTEVYEEVQPPDKVTLGRPASHCVSTYKQTIQQSGSEDSQGYVDVDKADSDDDTQLPSYLSSAELPETEESFPKTPPPALPPRDKKPVSPPIISSSHVSSSSSAPSLPPRSHLSQESSTPRGSSSPAAHRHIERKALPPIPVAAKDTKATHLSLPPLPQRNHSLDVSNPITSTSDSESDSPPPIPQRRGGGGRLTPTDGAKPKPAQRKQHPIASPKNISSSQAESSLDRSPRDCGVGRQQPAAGTNSLHGSSQSITSSLPPSSSHALPHSVTSSLPSTHTPAASGGKYPLPRLPPPSGQSDVGSAVTRAGRGGINSNKPKPPPTKQKPKLDGQQAVGGVTNKPGPPIPAKRTNLQGACGTRGENGPTPPPPFSATAASLVQELNQSHQNRLSAHRVPSSGLSESAVSSSSPISRRPPAILPKPAQSKQHCRPLSESEMATVSYKLPAAQGGKSTSSLINGQSSHGTPLNNTHATTNGKPAVRTKKPPLPPPKPR